MQISPKGHNTPSPRFAVGQACAFCGPTLVAGCWLLAACWLLAGGANHWLGRKKVKCGRSRVSSFGLQLAAKKKRKEREGQLRPRLLLTPDSNHSLGRPKLGHSSQHELANKYKTFSPTLQLQTSRSSSFDCQEALK